MSVYTSKQTNEQITTTIRDEGWNVLLRFDSVRFVTAGKSTVFCFSSAAHSHALEQNGSNSFRVYKIGLLKTFKVESTYLMPPIVSGHFILETKKGGGFQFFQVLL